MALGIPTYGSWNDPNAENTPITQQFSVAAETRRRGRRIDRVSNQHKNDSNKSEYNSETESTKSVPDNFMSQPRLPSGSNQRNNSRDSNSNQPRGPPQNNNLGTNTLQSRPPLPKGPKQPPVGYNNSEFTPQARLPPGPSRRNDHDANTNLQRGSQRGPMQLVERESTKVVHENFTPPNRPTSRPSSSQERNNRQVYPGGLPIGPNSRTGIDEKLRNVVPVGYYQKGNNFAIQTSHDRRPSTLSESNLDLLPKRKEDYAQKEANIARHQLKSPSAPQFGKWNIDPNCTQEYTKQFVEVRHEREKNLVEVPHDPAPVQPYIYVENTNKTKKKRRNWFIDCLFPRVRDN